MTATTDFALTDFPAIDTANEAAQVVRTETRRIRNSPWPGSGGATQSDVTYEVHERADGTFVTVNFLTDIFSGVPAERREMSRSHPYDNFPAAYYRGREWLFPGSHY